MEDKPVIPIAPVATPNPLPEGAESTSQKVTTVQENTTSAKQTGTKEITQSVNSRKDLITQIILGIMSVSVTLAFIYTSVMKIENALLAGVFGTILGFYTRGIINKSETK